MQEICLIASVASVQECLKTFVRIVLVEVVERSGVVQVGACEHSFRCKGRIERQRANSGNVIRDFAKHAGVLVRGVAFESVLMSCEPASAQRDFRNRVEEGVSVARVAKVLYAAVRHVFKSGHGGRQCSRAEIVIQKLRNVVFGLLE